MNIKYKKEKKRNIKWFVIWSEIVDKFVPLCITFTPMCYLRQQYKIHSKRGKINRIIKYFELDYKINSTVSDWLD